MIHAIVVTILIILLYNASYGENDVCITNMIVSCIGLVAFIINSLIVKIKASNSIEESKDIPNKPFIIDSDGNPMWDELNVEQSTEALLYEVNYNDKSAKTFAKMQIDIAQEELNKIEEYQPKYSKDLKIYLQVLNTFDAKKTELLSKIDKWNNILHDIDHQLVIHDLNQHIEELKKTSSIPKVEKDKLYTLPKRNHGETSSDYAKRLKDFYDNIKKIEHANALKELDNQIQKQRKRERSKFIIDIIKGGLLYIFFTALLFLVIPSIIRRFITKDDSSTSSIHISTQSNYTQSDSLIKIINSNHSSTHEWAEYFNESITASVETEESDKSQNGMTLHTLYKDAIKDCLLDSSVSEAQFADILRDSELRKAYFENSNKIILHAYGDYDLFCKKN